MPQDVKFVAYRHAGWGGPSGCEQVVFLGEDFADAAFAWSFANTEGGEVVLTLQNAALGQQGVSAFYDPDYVHPVDGTQVGATVLVAQIDESTLRALPSSRRTTEMAFAHTLYVTPTGAAKQVQFSGSMVVRQGAPN